MTEGAGPATRTPRAVEPRHAKQLEWLRTWARLLDNQFRVPGTEMRFGLDPILGLIPGLGDVTTPLFSGLIVLQAFRMRVPKIVQARMVANVIVDVATGVVPFLGDLFDFAWKSNSMNMRLLERHAYQVVQPSRGDWVFVGVVFFILATIVIVPIVLAIWLIHAIESLRYL
jgi:uncharacterized protein DUF4112